MSIPDNCLECLFEKHAKMPYQPSCGTVPEWLENLKPLQTIEDCQQWWKEINTIEWTPQDYKTFIRIYFHKVAKLTCAKYWKSKNFPEVVSLNLDYQGSNSPVNHLL